MNIFDLRLFTLSAVVFTSLSCLAIIILDIINAKKRQRRLKLNLALYFGSHIITGFCFIMYFYSPNMFIWANWLFMLSIVLLPVFLYAFIFEITKVDTTERFSKFHFLVPAVLSVFMLVLSIVIPEQEQLLTIKGNGIYTGNSIIFYVFSNKLIFRIIFNVVYVVLSFRRLPRYRKYITSYSANESKASLRWVTILLFFIISLVFVPLYGLFVSRSGLASSYVTYFQVSMLIFQYSFLTYHVVKRNYILQEASELNDNVYVDQSLINNSEIEIVDDNHFLKKSLLGKKQFEEFMHSHKPYLEPNLKITDIAEQMMINRTYISTFINTEYGVNFSSYINQLRLFEYDQLRADSKFKDKSNSELSEIAGFGSYRSYARFAASHKNKG